MMSFLANFIKNKINQINNTKDMLVMLKGIVNQLNSMTNLLTSYVDKMAHLTPSKTGL